MSIIRSHYYGPRDQKKVFWVEMYESTIILVVCHSISKTYKRITGQEDNFDSCYGLHSDDGNGHHVIFLRRDHITHATTAHEIFHCAHRIMERVGVKMDKEHHEAHALLVGWITNKVYKQLKTWRIKIK